MEFALLGVAAAVAVICAIVTLLVENHHVDKLAEEAIENNAQQLAEDLDSDNDDESTHCVNDTKKQESAMQKSSAVVSDSTDLGLEEAQPLSKKQAKELAKANKASQNAEKAAEKALKKADKKTKDNKVDAPQNNEEVVVAQKKSKKSNKTDKSIDNIATTQQTKSATQPIKVETDAKIEAETAINPVAQVSKTSTTANKTATNTAVKTEIEKDIESKEKLPKPSSATSDIANKQEKSSKVVDAKPATAKIEKKENSTANNTVKKVVTPKSKVDDDMEAKIYGKYVVKELSEEEFQFELFDNKGKLLFQSVKYSTRDNCKKNIGYFKKNVISGAFSVDGTSANGYSFVLKRGVVSYIGVNYKTRAAADNAISAVKSFSHTDVIKES